MRIPTECAVAIRKMLQENEGPGLSFMLRDIVEQLKEELDMEVSHLWMWPLLESGLMDRIRKEAHRQSKFWRIPNVPMFACYDPVNYRWTSLEYADEPTVRAMASIACVGIERDWKAHKALLRLADSMCVTNSDALPLPTLS